MFPHLQRNVNHNTLIYIQRIKITNFNEMQVRQDLNLKRNANNRERREYKIEESRLRELKQASIFPSLTYTNSTFNFVIHFYVEYLFLLRLNKPKRNINKNTMGLCWMNSLCKFYQHVSNVFYCCCHCY